MALLGIILTIMIIYAGFKILYTIGCLFFLPMNHPNNQLPPELQKQFDEDYKNSHPEKIQ